MTTRIGKRLRYSAIGVFAVSAAQAQTTPDVATTQPVVVVPTLPVVPAQPVVVPTQQLVLTQPLTTPPPTPATPPPLTPAQAQLTNFAGYQQYLSLITYISATTALSLEAQRPPPPAPADGESSPGTPPAQTGPTFSYYSNSTDPGNAVGFWRAPPPDTGEPKVPDFRQPSLSYYSNSTDPVNGSGFVPPPPPTPVPAEAPRPAPSASAAAPIPAPSGSVAADAGAPAASTPSSVAVATNGAAASPNAGAEALGTSVDLQPAQPADHRTLYGEGPPSARTPAPSTTNDVTALDNEPVRAEHRVEADYDDVGHIFGHLALGGLLFIVACAVATAMLVAIVFGMRKGTGSRHTRAR